MLLLLLVIIMPCVPDCYRLLMVFIFIIIVNLSVCITSVII